MKAGIWRAGAFLLFVASVSSSTAACGGSGGGAGTSGVDPSKKLITLTDAEKGMLCDWMVARAGSYGNPGTCDRTQPTATSPFLTYDDQAACIADARDPTDVQCQATVGQLETCVGMLPACATLNDVNDTPACAAVDGC
jgi:hypothetical protein